MELVPTLPALDGLDSSFSSFYVCTATRKFLFFLDPLRTGRVRIIDILSSNFLEDLLEVFVLLIISLLYNRYFVIRNLLFTVEGRRPSERNSGKELVFSTFGITSIRAIFELGQRPQRDVES